MSEPIVAPASSAPAVGQLEAAPSPPPPPRPEAGMGAPAPTTSTTPLGQLYEGLRLLWAAIDALQSTDGSVAAGIVFARQKQAVEAALAQAMATLAQIDQSSASYQQQLVDYGSTLRTQLQTLQAECATTTPGTPAAAAAAGTFTPKATGAIALGALLVGGMIGFGSARVAADK